ncbi:hypothetical protein GCM10027092_05300 [Yaniella soli]
MKPYAILAQFRDIAGHVSLMDPTYAVLLRQETPAKRSKDIQKHNGD